MAGTMAELAQAVVSGLLIGSIYALVAVGLTLIYGVMDIVNFAHGDLLMVGMYASFFAWLFFKLDPLVSVLLAAATVGLLGVAVYMVAIRRALTGPPLAQIIVTFGILVLLRGLAQYLFTADTRGIAHPLIGHVRITLGGVVAGGPQLVAAAGATLFAAAIGWLISRTEIGAAIAATAEDARAARLVGISPGRIQLLVWAIAGAAVGAAGALLMNYYTVSPEVGAGFGLIAFVVVAMGGFGSLKGAMVAGLAAGVVQDLVGLYQPAYGLAAIFLLYLAVTLVRPRGLYGTR